jgi:hypothetical protein
LLLVGTALHAGCGNNASGLTTSSTDVPTITSQDPMARPIQVAWTSARAQRCGFYFDPAKLKASYIGYESRQAGMTTDQLAKIQVSYDTTFKSITARVSADPDYCTDKKGSEIKVDLQRHLAGDFTPNLPKPKPVDPCGFFGCSASSSATDEKLDAKKLFDDMERKKGR